MKKLITTIYLFAILSALKAQYVENFDLNGKGLMLLARVYLLIPAHRLPIFPA